MIHVTEHKRGKMLHMTSINTSSLHNPFCLQMQQTPGTICGHCYAARLQKLYGRSEMPFVRNGELLSSRDLEMDEIPRLNRAFIRFNAFGELLNEQHYYNLCMIARFNEHANFALWTKRPDLVETSITPDNMRLIYSSLYINKEEDVPDGFDKCFTVYTKDAMADINCHSQCFECRKCYYKYAGKPFHIRERINRR